MYTGPSTEDAPIPNPPRKRNTSSDGQFHANMQPSAEITYNTAVMRSVSRPPSLCPMLPADIAPTTVPATAMNTVTPCS